MFHAHRRAIANQTSLASRTNLSRRNFFTAKNKKKNNNKKPRDDEQVRNSSYSAEAEGAKEEASQQQKENIFNRFSAWYSHKLETHPLITKSITGGLIAASGDTVCQFGTFKQSQSDSKENGGMTDKRSFFKEVWDPMRTVHFYCMGGFFAAPLNHIWFNWLSKNIPGQTFGPITKRVGLDQLLWTPTWTVAWMAIFWTLEGTEPSDIPQGLKENYPTVITANWVLWIPAQYINFYFTPLKYQVLFTNFTELIWNTYLSFANAERNKNGSSEKDISTDDDKTEEEKESELRRQKTQTLHRRRTFR